MNPPLVEAIVPRDDDVLWGFKVTVGSTSTQYVMDEEGGLFLGKHGVCISVIPKGTDQLVLRLDRRYPPQRKWWQFWRDR